MKIGEFAIHIKNNSLWICYQPDRITCVVSFTDIIINPDNPLNHYMLDSNSIKDHIVNPTFTEIQGIMKARAFPSWVVAIMQQQAQTSGFKIGTVLENINSGNLWIVTKDNSGEISKLFDVKSKSFCKSIDYKRDTIKKTNSVLKVMPNYMNSSMPQWAMDLIKGMAPRSGSVPAALIQTGWADTHLEKRAEKKIDKPVDTCDHVFKPYFGFRECYEYCEKCDKKRNNS